MNWTWIGECAWHGLSAAVITGATTLGVLQAWPTAFQWLLLGAGMALGFVKGVNGYLVPPNAKP